MSFYNCKKRVIDKVAGSFYKTGPFSGSPPCFFKEVCYIEE